MLLLHLSDVDEERWAKNLRALLGNYPLVRRNERFDPGDVRYVFVWKPTENAFDGLTNLKAILSLGAGVDALLKHKSPPPFVPIIRFTDRQLTQCMSDYIIANVTMHQRCFTRYQNDQERRNWRQFYPPPAWDISVGVMGLGALGHDAAKRLIALGFTVNGWSRTEKQIDGAKIFCRNEQFDDFLGQSDILVNLLPLTPQTRGILDYRTFLKLRRGRLKGGPAIINAARGGHQNEDDIARALKDKTLGAASLDVFNIEPLPKDSPLWELKNCYITPHIAAISTPENGAEYFARVLLDHENGRPLVNVVDRDKGY